MLANHRAVLLKEAIDFLNVKKDGIYIDGTFGRGGHAAEILGKLGDKGRLIAIDKDPEAILATKRNPAFQDERFQIEQNSFNALLDIVQRENLVGNVDGILLDLGVSSNQLDDASRGFSFLNEGALDMRMNPDVGIDAATWINSVKESDLVEVLKTYGEERFAKRIASAIVQARKKEMITQTTTLANIIKQASPVHEKNKHPATRTFQAIRIFINNELGDLKTCLTQSMKALTKGGRLVVISFHSLEDRIVKQFMKSQAQGDAPPDVPLFEHQIEKYGKRITKKAVRPQLAEIETNPRSRSALLRVLEKIK